MKIIHYAVASALLMPFGVAYAQELPRLPPGPAAGHDATLLIGVTPTVTLSALASLVILITDSGGLFGQRDGRYESAAQRQLHCFFGHPLRGRPANSVRHGLQRFVYVIRIVGGVRLFRPVEEHVRHLEHLPIMAILRARAADLRGISLSCALL